LFLHDTAPPKQPLPVSLKCACLIHAVLSSTGPSDYKAGLMKELKDFADFEAFIASFTNYERLRCLPAGPEAFGLDRMRRLAAELGEPQHSFPAVHIAGTKGKGSTSLILEALLAAEGFLVGTYTSPHVEDLRERIRLGGRSIGGGELVGLLNSILPVLESRAGRPDFPTFFELMTALSMLHFARSSVDWGIFEVGLGGRLDATNILSPRWTSITSIGLEHTQVLGSTLAAIAREKAGIIKERTAVVLGRLPAEAQKTILEIAALRAAPVLEAAPEHVRLAGPGLLEIDGMAQPVESSAIRGPALRADLSIALAIHERILESLGRSPLPERIAGALAALQLPARVELFPGRPPVILDGAHTAESFRALRETLEEIDFPRPRTLVLSLAADKLLDPILTEAQALADEIFLTRADPARSYDPLELRSRLRRGRVIEEPLEALEEARRLGLATVVGGSFYLAGKLRATLRSGLLLASAAGG
jgi:dihydrofolate synthase/folylpolyglutamate synthase